MADAIVIQVKLGTDDIDRAGKEIASKLSNALDVGVKAAREAGKKIGEALGGGIEAGARYTSREERERAHARRLEAIHAQSASRLKEIETRKQAQLDAIRERAAQREIEQQRKIVQASQSGGNFQTFLRRYSSTIREAGESIQQAGYGALGLTTAIIGVGTAAVRSAIEIDKQVNALKALTGSAEAAEKRFAQLIAISQKTPGLTASLATTLDAQLRVANVTEQTINRILPAIGRLNAISPVGDASEFARNLAQIGQSFDKADIKQLVERSAFSGEILKQLFNVDSATNAEAIRESVKKLGIKTVDEFVSAFAQAAENNPKLASVTESLGTQLEKLQDRITIALRPLGVKLLDAIVPAVEAIVPVIENVLNAFSRLSPGLQTAILVFGALAASIGPVIIGLGGLIQFVGAIGNLTTVLTALGASGVVATAGVAGFSATLGPMLLIVGGVAAAIALLAGANKYLSEKNKDATVTINANIVASKQQIAASTAQIDELQKLTAKTKLSNSEQKKIEEIYSNLTPLQRERVKLFAAEGGGIDTVSGKLPALIELLKRENEERKKKAQQDAIESGKKIANDTRLAISAYHSLTEQSKKLNKELEDNSKKLLEAEKSGKVFIDFTGRSTPIVEGYRKENERLTTQLDRVNDQKEKAKKNLDRLTGSHLEGAHAAGLTTAEYLRQAFSIYKNGIQGKELSTILGNIAEKEKTLAQATETATEKIKKLNDEFAELLKQKNFKGIDEKINTTIGGIAANAPNTKDALRQLNELRRQAADIDKGIKDKQQFEKNLDALQKVVDGKPQVSAGQARKGDRDAKAIAEAQRRAEESAFEDEFRFIKASNDRILKNNEYFYSQGLRTATEFYSQKLALTQKNTQEEIKGIDSRIAQDRAAFENEKLTTQERIELIDKLAKAGAERVLKVKELAGTEVEIIREKEAELKRIEEERFNLSQSFRENQFNLQLDANNRIIQDNERLYETGKRSAEEYYQTKIKLLQDNIQGEIDLNIESIKRQKEIRADLNKDSERYIEATRTLNQLEVENIILLRQKQDVEKNVNLERKNSLELLEREIKALKDRRNELNNPELAAKRREKAQVEAEYEVAKASDDAANEIIKSRARIADASVYHADRANAIFLDHLAKQQSVTEAVADSMIRAYEGVASGLDRGIDKMTKKLGAFGDFVNGIIKSIARNLLASLFAPQQQGGGQQSASGGLFGGILGGLFGGNRGGGGGIFGPGGTPVFNPNGFTPLGSTGSGGLNLTSISQLSSLLTPQSSSGGGIFGGGAGGGSIITNPAQFLKSSPLFLPLTGGLLGSSLGGKSTLGKILGGVGGGIIGLGGTFAAGGFASSTALAALFSNPFTIPLAIGAIVGAVFLGKAKQRGKDEEAAGVLERQVMDANWELANQIELDKITADQARQVFESEIISSYISQINQLKTKSVRESRLRNQVPDLRNHFNAVVGPAIERQKQRGVDAEKRRQLGALFIPEFAVGGFVPGTIGSPQLVLAHGGEMVINPLQQTANLMQAAWHAGVPGAQEPATTRSETQQPTNITVTLVVGKEMQNELWVNGAKSQDGYKVIVNQVNNGMEYKDIIF